MVKYNLSKADSHLGAAIALGIATLLLLFTCISSPVVESMRIYRLRYRFETAVRWVDVGLWGYCVEDLQAYASHSIIADIDGVTFLQNDVRCSASGSRGGCRLLCVQDRVYS